jgi:hypothetical protein
LVGVIENVMAASFKVWSLWKFNLCLLPTIRRNAFKREFTCSAESAYVMVIFLRRRVQS